ncbi:sigma-54-dependent transcriptional regulator [Aureibacter tunicatorum]|uniref:DNA-binding NtrC family response regulator n=1 Tax=Aureibacter tunicatorum TaxID=866807 RepID=A0AAE4BPD9_9BACT|nr:sigma-54 dependent transcriptional regulator [Aureibacter tunicatorum]MDR6237879.1 DNA-binding NtrC family response regulator [Aureibacter tunicatorum]
MKGKILILDDNRALLSALDILLAPHYECVKCIHDPKLLFSELSKTDYQLLLLDMNFASKIQNGNEGLYWLKEAKSRYPHLSIVMITAYGNIELAVETIKLGASDFILKPWENKKMLETVKKSIELSFNAQKKQDKSNSKDLKTTEKAFTVDQILGQSPVMCSMKKIIERVSKTDTNVLISGENGTGKELVAKAIHGHSNRNGHPLVNVDVGSLSETLFESEMFGHVKGAYTDAKEDRVGKFELANDGSIFLDEISNLSYGLQAKLLKVLQNREIVKLGSNIVIPIDIRLICATNKSITKMVSQQLFREDLFYRINTIQIEVPPLRDRGDDILLLANFFIDKFCSKYHRDRMTLSDQAQQKILNYHWPGNVRQLEHNIERLVILNESDTITVSSLQLENIDIGNVAVKDITLEEMEKLMIVNALKRFENNISMASSHLGITRQTLYNKMKKYSLS